MRDQGRLVEWFDDKGYGFIQPNDSAKDRVFLHIKDFAKPGPRPIVGCALDYLVVLDERGRYRAQQVMYLKAAQAKTCKQNLKAVQVKQAQKLQPMQIACVVYILFLVGSSLGPVCSSGLVLLLVSLMNALSYWLYAQDKEAAQLGDRRVRKIPCIWWLF